MGEDKGDLLHKGPQPDTETITSTQLDHRLHCLIQGVQYSDKLYSSALKAVEFWWKVDEKWTPALLNSNWASPALYSLGNGDTNTFTY